MKWTNLTRHTRVWFWGVFFLPLLLPTFVYVFLRTGPSRDGLGSIDRISEGSFGQRVHVIICQLGSVWQVSRVFRQVSPSTYGTSLLSAPRGDFSAGFYLVSSSEFVKKTSAFKKYIY